jgi:hypothetical protein
MQAMPARIMECLFVFDTKNVSVINGPTFCHEDKMRFGIHDIAFITLGNHV